MALSKEQVLKILRSYRPDLKTEEDWQGADLIMVLQWLLPAEWQNAERRIKETK
jgi:hypothetical protein